MLANRKMRGIAALALSFGFTGFVSAGFVSAAPIPSLFNTGVSTNDANGNPTAVVADDANDPHYVITSTPTGPVTPFSAVVVDQNGGNYPFTDGVGDVIWQADSSTSKWISVEGNETTATELPFNYTYKTTFDLTGLNPSTAQISGKFYEDDFMTDILINTTDTGITQNGGNTNGAGQTFNITSGFVSGINTLTFIVYNYPTGNSPNPTGLDVQMTGTASVSLPEPASLGVLAVGALMLGHRNRRAKK